MLLNYNRYITLRSTTIYSETPSTRYRITPTHDLIYELDLVNEFDLFTYFREISIEFYNGHGIPIEDQSPGCLVLSHSGLAYVLLLRLILHKICHIYLTFNFEHPLGLLFLLFYFTTLLAF